MRTLSHLAATSVASCMLAPRLWAESVPAGKFSQLCWDWNPLILVSLVFALSAYFVGRGRMNRSVRGKLFGWGRCAAFTAGIGTLFAVLITPLDALDDQLFSAHMLQHLVLMMVAPPLLILGRPGIAFLRAFSLAVRRAASRLWVRSGLRSVLHAVMSPLVVWMLCSAALWFWHLPGPYGWALQSEVVHALEHVCFLVTSLMFWSLVLQPVGRRLDYGSTMLFVATFAVQNGLLGALLTFAGRPLYVAYLPTTATWGLTPLEDQQLAGLMMWIPASLIHLSTLGVLFVRWMRAAERSEADRVPGWSALPRSAGLLCAALLCLVVFGLAGCDQAPAASEWNIAGADAARGPALIGAYGCGSCHTIPGVHKATGKVGPPLGEFGQRAYIAGMLRNNPENLIRWLREPQSVVPGNAMLDMGVTEKDARDLAAFLYGMHEH